MTMDCYYSRILRQHTKLHENRTMRCRFTIVFCKVDISYRPICLVVNTNDFVTYLWWTVNDILRTEYCHKCNVRHICCCKFLSCYCVFNMMQYRDLICMQEVMRYQLSLLTKFLIDQSFSLIYHPVLSLSYLIKTFLLSIFFLWCSSWLCSRSSTFHQV